MALHFTPEERVAVFQMLHEKVSKADIARRLGRHRSSIFKELRRNSIPHSYGRRPRYCPVTAQQKADQRRHQPRTKMMACPAIREYVEKRMKEYWSPDQIAGRMKLDFASDPRLRISHQTIYTWIYTHDHRRCWQRCLRRSRKRKRRRNKTPGSAAIANRPEVIERRERLGDWEGDTIVGAGRSGALVSLVDRKSGYLVLAKVSNLKSRTVRRSIHRRLQPLPPELRHSMTLDNGSEFAQHEQLTRSLGIAVYFAEPRCPWQRGTNENTNGLARQFFPKGSRLDEVSHQAVAHTEILLNNRPRKRLGYRTPSEVFHQPASVAILA